VFNTTRYASNCVAVIASQINIMSESFAQLLEESMAYTEMKPGAILNATVLEITPDVVMVNAGLKSEGVIPTEQFYNDRGELEVAVGDVVEVALDAVEDGFGETRLSREKAKRAKAWKVLEEAFENEEVVTGKITGKVKGGFTVDINDIRAFLPGSLVDVRPVRDTAYLEGKDLEFKVIKLDRRRNNVVVSRRAVVESEYSAEREALLESLHEGQVLKGVVKNLTDYGAFLDLGGIDGLLHITDMAWKRVKHPSEVVNIGDEIEVKVLKFDRERNRVSLGLKQLGEDPWVDISRRYPVNTRLFGKVTNITDYGCFVEIEDGVEGLVHVSEIDWTNKNVNPAKVVAISDEVEVMILDIDEERRRISLGMKQCLPNPWEDFAQNFNKNDRVSGTIKSITDFGIFVGLDGGIDGLVHLSDISWHVPGEEAVRSYKKGDEIDAVVLAVDPERERISLGVKQLDKDPFSNFVAEHPKGSILNGTVTEVDAKAAVIDLGDEIIGTLRASELSRDRVEDARTVLNVGDQVEAKFIGVDRKNRTITLSIKAKEFAEEAEVLQDYSSSGSATTSLGELLKEKMGQNNS
jgi:small subunit ribosomal protein S1